MRVPIADPRRAFLRHERAIREGIDRVLASGRYIGGGEVDELERELERTLGLGPVVAVASGTDALELALRACGVAPGERVATVALTAVATVAAIERAGAIPVLVDVEPERWTMDPASLERALATKVRAVVPVHLFGQPAGLPSLGELAHRHGALLVEDCAQAHGAAIDGVPCGRWGAAAAFSFYPTKNLGALGDAGAVATRDVAIAERVRLLREYGWRERNRSEVAGVNSRLDPIQAAVLRAKLPGLAEANERRRAIATSYRAALEGTDIAVQRPAAGELHVHHQFAVRVADRDDFRARLDRLGIETAIHYPSPIHLQPAYEGRIEIAPGGLSETERACRELVSLPVFPELTDAEVEQVVAALRPAH